MSTEVSSPNTHNADIPFSLRQVERSDIHDTLRSIKNYRIALVSAPPGYGKSTTVAAFARQSSMPCAWHSIDESERDLPNLHLHSLRSLEFIAPGIEALGYSDEGAAELAGNITSYLRAHVKHHVLYILDDMHLVIGSPAAEQWIQALVEGLPANCHLVLMSRALPDLPLAEYIARGEVLAIGQDDLRFSTTYAEKLAATFDETIPVETIRRRIDALDGWPAGIILSLQPLPHDVEATLLNGRHGPEAVFDALAESMLQRQSPLVQDFLLSSSILSRLTPELCGKVLELPSSPNMLATILKRNLFVSRIAGGLVYHRLFRTFLQNRLKQRQPDRFVQLNVRAAEWFSRHDENDEAFYHYMVADCIDEAVEIAQRVYRTYFNRGRFETLLSWRAYLGDEAARAPRLIYTCAMIYIDRYAFTKAQEELGLAASLFDRATDRMGLAEVEMQGAMILLRQGKHEEVRSAADAIRSDESLPQLLRARARHLLGLSLMGLGDINAAIEHLQAIVTLYEDENDAYSVSVVLQDLEVAYTRAGRLDEASHCLQRVVALRRKIGRQDALALALNNLGYHYHQRGNYRQALAALEEGLHVIAQAADRRTESYLLWSMADLQRDLGNFAEALHHYNRAYELSQGVEPSLQRSITLGMSILYRWQGEYRLADRLAGDAVHIGELYADMPEYMVIEAMQCTNRVLAAPDNSSLDGMLDLYDRSLASGATTEFIQIAALVAVSALRIGDEATAVRCLDDVARVSRQFESAHILAAEAAHNQALADLARSHNSYQTLHQMVQRLRVHRTGLEVAARDETAVNGSRTTYSIRVFALDAELIERDGAAIPASLWRSNRAMEFFLYLVFEKAKRRQEISLEFWPDSSSQRVRSNFHTTLYRARQAVGEDTIVYDGYRYQISPDVDLWCDAHEMAALVDEARLLPQADARAEDLWQRALALYRGPLLPGLDSAWVTVHRTMLQEYHIEALLGAGRCAQSRQSYQEAIDFINTALIVDPFREEAYRTLFKCYATLGEYRQVVSQFHEMQALFENELGITPSPETMSLMQQLLYS